MASILFTRSGQEDALSFPVFLIFTTLLWDGVRRVAITDQQLYFVQILIFKVVHKRLITKQNSLKSDRTSLLREGRGHSKNKYDCNKTAETS